MARIFSWKLDDSRYAYITQVNETNPKHISSRLTGDSITNIVSKISNMDKTTYSSLYSEMNEEIKSYYGSGLPSGCSQFYDTSLGDNTNYVILTGKDGNGGGTSSAGAGGGSGFSGFDWDKYNEFINYIENLIKESKDEIENLNSEVEDKINDFINKQTKDALEDIQEAEKKLDALEEKFEKYMDSAKDVLSKAEAVFQLGDGNITAQDLKNVLTGYTVFNSWLTSYSGFIQSERYDYDYANKVMGGIAVGEDDAYGAFGMMAISLNAISGTVGTVAREMNASRGEIRDTATWVNTCANTIGEVVRFMSASGAVIQDMASFVDEGNISSIVEREMNAVEGKISDSVSTRLSGIVTYVNSTMDGINGQISQTISRYDSLNQKIDSIGSQMNASAGSYTEWVNQLNYLSGQVSNITHEMSVQNGDLTTVTDRFIDKDQYGYIYYIDKDNNGEWDKSTEGRAYYYEGNFYYDTGHTSVLIDSDKLLVKPVYSSYFSSYISQTSTRIAMSVFNASGSSAAIIAELSGNTSFIRLIADKVVVTGDMIAKAISAETIDVGGIHIGGGRLYSTMSNFIDINTVSGTAVFCGDITANSLTLRGNALNTINGIVSGAIGTSAQDAVNHWLETCGSTLKSGDNVYIVSAYVYFSKTDWSKTYDDKSTDSGYTKYIEYKTYINVNPTEHPDATPSSITYEATDGSGVIYTNVGYGSEDDTYVQISKNGLLQANNAIIYGTIYANDGQIGGWTISGKVLTSKEVESSLIARKENVIEISPQSGIACYTNTLLADNPIINNWAIKKDGSGYLARENISWTSGGSVSIKGGITATSITLTGSAVDTINNVVSGAIGNSAEQAIAKWMEQCGKTISSGDKVYIVSGIVYINQYDWDVQTGSTYGSNSAYTQYIEYKTYINVNPTEHPDATPSSITYEQNGDSTSIFTNVGYGKSGDTFVQIDKNGLLQANNAVIYGTLYANAGQIGGWTIKDYVINSVSSTTIPSLIKLDPNNGIMCVTNDNTNWKLDNRGGGLLANGNISWTSGGNVSIKGDIVAKSFETEESNNLSVKLTEGEFQFVYKGDKIAYFALDSGSSTTDSYLDLFLKRNDAWYKFAFDKAFTGTTIIKEIELLIDSASSSSNIDISYTQTLGNKVTLYSINGKYYTSNVESSSYLVKNAIYYRRNNLSYDFIIAVKNPYTSGTISKYIPLVRFCGGTGLIETNQIYEYEFLFIDSSGNVSIKYGYSFPYIESSQGSDKPFKLTKTSKRSYGVINGSGTFSISGYPIFCSGESAEYCDTNCIYLGDYSDIYSSSGSPEYSGETVTDAIGHGFLSTTTPAYLNYTGSSTTIVNSIFTGNTNSAGYNEIGDW